MVSCNDLNGKDRMKSIYRIIILLVVMMGFMSGDTPIRTQEECNVYSPLFQQQSMCIGTIVSDKAWVYLRSGGNDTWEIYKFNLGDRIVVRYQENGYYFVYWRFDNSHDPIFGWVLKENIILGEYISQGKEETKHGFDFFRH